MQSLDDAFARHEGQVDTLLKQCSQLMGALKGWKRACADGAFNDRQKHSERAVALSGQIPSAVEVAAETWQFEPRQYLSSDAWQRELIESAAKHAGSLRLFMEGEELVCSPVVIRADSARSTLRIGRARWTKLRPTRVLDELSRLREQGARQNPQELLDHLHRAVEHLNESKPQLGSTVYAKLRDIYELFCLTPGWKKDNSEAAFAQQLYALHRSGVQVTRSGKKYEFELPTGHPKPRDLFDVVAEDGRTIRYYMIHFC